MKQSGEANIVGFIFLSDAGSKAKSETVHFNKKEMMEADHIYIYIYIYICVCVSLVTCLHHKP